MKTSILLTVILLTIFFSVNGYSQIRHTNRGLSLEAGFVYPTSVDENGVLNSTGVYPIIGFGTFFKLDAIKISGELSYIPTENKLFTVGGRLTTEIPIREDAVYYPYSIGFNYRLFVSNGDIHAVGLSVQYDKSLYFIRSEFGIATRSMKNNRPSSGYAMMVIGYKLNWRN